MTTPSFFETLEILQFASSRQGAHLLVLGAVHGNEICGPAAIRRLAAALGRGELTLGQGRVTLVPVCNPLAYAKNTRFIEKNLNRVIAPLAAPQAYEEKMAQLLLPLIGACDLLLDLHSYQSGEKAFVFQDSDKPDAAAFARTFGGLPIVTGWPEMFAAQEAAALNAGDTCGYATRQGKPAVCVECGFHEAPEAQEAAYDAILAALRFAGIVERLADDVCANTAPPLLVQAKKVFPKKKAGRLSRAWQNFDPVKGGAVIGLYDDGTQEIAPADGVILLPHEPCALGTEWFYWGERG